MQINELILATSSITRTRLFYHKTLELPILNELEDAISFKAGKTILTFQLQEHEKPFYHVAFNITNNKFSDSLEWLDKKLDILPTDNGLPIAIYPDWNAESFYFYDNNGSILEFITRFDLPYHSNKPFSTDDIVEISEIGLVVDDVQAVSKELHEKHTIPYFKKGPRLHDFITMGDEHGLLLVAQKNRPWVPTNKAALPYPITIKTDDALIQL